MTVRLGENVKGLLKSQCLVCLLWATVETVAEDTGKGCAPPDIKGAFQGDENTTIII